MPLIFFSVKSHMGLVMGNICPAVGQRLWLKAKTHSADSDLCDVAAAFLTYLGPSTGRRSTSGIRGCGRIWRETSSADELHICCFNNNNILITTDHSTNSNSRSKQITFFSFASTFFSSSPNLCLISSREARWVLARTHVYEGGCERHVSSLWKRLSASCWPTAANTWR